MKTYLCSSYVLYNSIGTRCTVISLVFFFKSSWWKVYFLNGKLLVISYLPSYIRPKFGPSGNVSSFISNIMVDTTRIVSRYS